MYVYYDRVSKMYILDAGDDGIEFLGPGTMALVKLQSYGLTNSQATEAVLQAFMNLGAPVNLADIRRMACKERKFFRSNVG